KKVDSTDKKRSTYYNFYTNKIWGQASSYDICLNTSLLGVEGAVDIVLKTFEKLFVA
ncbi:MAG: cytidylate kinase family protein, partial [Bacteroidetes bacterium]|nr:cytidylate kinase family protein [Bacteroidota bacterium]